MHTLTCRILLLTSFLGLIRICQAQPNVGQTQECKYLKVQTPTRLSYSSIIEIPPDYNATGNQFFTVDVSKHVIKSDTLFILGLSIRAVNVSTKADSAMVIFHFSDGSSLVQAKQPLNVLLMTKGNALLSTNLRLTKNELLVLRAKLLADIMVIDSKVLVSDEVAKSFKKVVNCILNIW